MLSTPKFTPGFRISAVDIAVLAIGTIASIGLAQTDWRLSFVIGFVVAHFFLFCNILRLARPLELTWAGVFTTLAGLTVTTEVPGWTATVLVTLGLTAILAVIELRKPSYHGVGWQTINPALPGWWEEPVGSRVESDTASQTGARKLSNR